VSHNLRRFRDELARTPFTHRRYEDARWLVGVLDAVFSRIMPVTDAEALDQLARLLSAPEWPGASGMEDVAEIVASTGRRIDQPGAPWEAH
jgi:hypothetical protein